MWLRALQFVTLVLVALLLGLAFAHVLERPAKLLYDAALYVTLQKTLYAHAKVRGNEPRPPTARRANAPQYDVEIRNAADRPFA